MIGYLKGKLLNAEEGVVLLENGGVGYEITCSASVYAKLLSANGGEVYVYTSVKEDGVSLFGFDGIEEKKMFLKLISVSGVGPKMGIGVLSEMSAKDLTLKIASGDVKGLSSVKGLGKKTAERIILELRDKVDGIGVSDSDSNAFIAKSSFSSEEEDAVLALVGLGFSRGESEKAVGAAKAEGISQIEKLISYALKNIK